MSDRWEANMRHLMSLDTQDLVRRARYCLRDAKARPALVNYAEIRTAQMLLAEALAQEPAREAAE